MAQLDGNTRLEKPTGHAHLCHGVEEAQVHARVHDYEEDHTHHHEKKSVLSKVKEKARKWRSILHRKKHGHNSDHVTPPWGVSLDEEDDGDDDEDPEFHGAPMYESEMAPEIYRDSNTKDFSPRKEMREVQHHLQDHQPVQGTVKRNALEDGCIDAPKVVDAQDHPNNGSNKTVTQAVSGILAPACTVVSGATTAISSKIQGPRPPLVSATARDEAVSKHTWDKGISVKEYLLQKLEPGEEDRVLSQMISEAISPRMRAGGAMDAGVVEKTKGAPTSLLEAEGSPIPVSTMPRASACASSEMAKPRLKKMLHSPSTSKSIERTPILEASRSLPASVGSATHPSGNLSNVRTVMLNTAHRGEIEERNGRTLQEYLN